ncbi:hypothetical protein B0H19DRAFT_1382358 [Mycena capillaripes]|nr:hypothetical protein B0H19DRAFT_1382358 [Mycena capillaripes]
MGLLAGLSLAANRCHLKLNEAVGHTLLDEVLALIAMEGHNPLCMPPRVYTQGPRPHSCIVYRTPTQWPDDRPVETQTAHLTIKEAATHLCAVDDVLDAK